LRSSTSTADRALLLCWPGYKDTFADDALARFNGNVLILSGRRRRRHTASDAFFERLTTRVGLHRSSCHPAVVGRHIG